MVGLRKTYGLINYNMIPKIIHYCWFGGNPLPELAKQCIESWRRFFPNYEIKEWNEDNFDINIVPYTTEAYKAKKYAFVSDYARFWILYKYGGLYFDTDVEVIKSMDKIIDRGNFMGCEKAAIPGATPMQMGVAPGLGLGVNPGLGLLKEILDAYTTFHFHNEDGTLNTKTIVDYTSEILCKHGLQNTSKIQNVADVWIYPHDYFAPKNVDTKLLTITNNTVSIHHYDASWAEWYDRAAGERGPKLERLLGKRLGGCINSYIYIYQRWGIMGALKKYLKTGK